jgi:hypothetical protein
MQKLSKFILFLVSISILLGCEEDPNKKLRRLRAEEFPKEYLKKYREEATIIVPYENCIKGKDEAVEKCLFLTAKDDMQRLVVNKYIAAREEYLRTGKLEESPENTDESSSKDTIKKQENHIILMKKFS